MGDSPKPGLLEELKRRNVFRVAAMYAVGGWLLLQIGEVTFEPLGMPEGSLRALILLVALGFPVALVLGWVFDWTEEGLVRTPDDPALEVARLRGHRRIDFAIIGLLTLALGMALFGPELEGGPAPSEPIRSIAVLPLEDPSDAAEQAYLAFGLTEALIAELAKVKGLRVISRTSVTPYAGSQKPIPTIAQELGVEAVVEGSVIRAGDRVRITAQLIDARSDFHLWAESYERSVADVLAVQAEVARAIAREIHLEVAPHAGVPRISPAAQEAYLKGYYFQMKRNREAALRAVSYFEEAIALDPTSPLAYAALADEYSCAPTHSWGIPDSDTWPSVPLEMLGRARRHALRALELDPSSPAGHNSLAIVRTFADWDWEGAEASHLRTMELSPGREWNHSTYGIFLGFMQRFDEALHHMETALGLDPLRIDTIMWLASLHIFRGEMQEARARWREAMEMDPAYPGLLQSVLSSFCGTQDHAEALAAIERGMRTYPDDPLVMGELAHCHAAAGDEAAARALLAEMNAMSARTYVSPVSRAAVHAALGEDDAAFAALEQGFRDRDPQILFLGLSPVWRRLADDPRHTDLMQRIGLPPAVHRPQRAALVRRDT